MAIGEGVEDELDVSYMFDWLWSNVFDSTSSIIS